MLLLGVIVLLYKRWRRDQVARLNSTEEVQMEVSSFWIKRSSRQPSHLEYRLKRDFFLRLTYLATASRLPENQTSHNFHHMTTTLLDRVIHLEALGPTRAKIYRYTHNHSHYFMTLALIIPTQHQHPLRHSPHNDHKHHVTHCANNEK